MEFAGGARAAAPVFDRPPVPPIPRVAARRVPTSAIRILRDRLLGHGSFGTVYEGVFEGSPVAVKVCRLGVGDDAQVELDMGLGEADIQASLAHVNILHVLCCAVHPDTAPLVPKELWVVLPLMPGASLADFLPHYSNRGDLLPAKFAPLPLLLRMKLLHDAAEALDYMHRDADCLHGDLKPANVLLSCRYSADTCLPPNIMLSPLRACLADFGAARKRAHRAETIRIKAAAPRDFEVQYIGSEMYMDPQSLMHAHCNRQASDVFSLAVMAWQVLTQRMPYHSWRPSSPSTTFKAWVAASDAHRPPLDDLPAEVRGVLTPTLSSMWRGSQEGRPTISDVLPAFRAALDDLRMAHLKLAPQEMPQAWPGPTWRLLGSGSCGYVYQVPWRGAECALKVISIQGRNRRDKEVVLGRFMEEVKLQSSLSHRGVVPVLGYHLRLPADADGRLPWELAVVLPKMHCSLEKAQRDGSVGGGGLLAAHASTLKRLRLVLQVAESVAYVHRQGLLHGDIKPASAWQQHARAAAHQPFSLTLPSPLPIHFPPLLRRCAAV